MTITLKVTAKGQITLRKEVLKHLGVQPGDQLNVDLLKDGRMQIRPKRGTSAATIFGMLAKPEMYPLSIDELNETAATGWAGEEAADPAELIA